MKSPIADSTPLTTPQVKLRLVFKPLPLMASEFILSFYKPDGEQVGFGKVVRNGAHEVARLVGELGGSEVAALQCMRRQKSGECEIFPTEKDMRWITGEAMFRS